MFTILTGSSKHLPSRRLNPEGVSRGAETGCVFRHRYRNRNGDVDLKPSELMAACRTDFTKYRGPNGQDLPEWPFFNENKPISMYLNKNPEAGPVPNIEKPEFRKKYFKDKREIQ